MIAGDESIPGILKLASCAPQKHFAPDLNPIAIGDFTEAPSTTEDLLHHARKTELVQDSG